MIKKTAYDLAGIQIRPAIQNATTGEYLVYHSRKETVEVVREPVTFGSWIRGLFRSKPKR